MEFLGQYSGSIAIVAADGALIVMHLLGFLALRGRKPELSLERGIFLYHLPFFSFGIVGGGVASYVFDGMVDIRVVALCASLQGIYAMTFLEAWSLSEGSYSSSILGHLNRRQGVDEVALRNIGAAKRVARSDNLVSLGLLAHDGGNLLITSKGRKLAKFLAFSLWLIDVKQSG